jgi:hypothetical protein
VFVDQPGVSALGGALTGGAAFSALLVLIPAGLGLFVGGRIGRSKSADSDDSEDAESPSPRPRRRVRAEGEPPRPSPRIRSHSREPRV